MTTNDPPECKDSGTDDAYTRDDGATFAVGDWVWTESALGYDYLGRVNDVIPNGIIVVGEHRNDPDPVFAEPAEVDPYEDGETDD